MNSLSSYVAPISLSIGISTRRRYEPLAKHWKKKSPPRWRARWRDQVTSRAVLPLWRSLCVAAVFLFQVPRFNENRWGNSVHSFILINYLFYMLLSSNSNYFCISDCESSSSWPWKRKQTRYINEEGILLYSFKSVSLSRSTWRDIRGAEHEYPHYDMERFFTSSIMFFMNSAFEHSTEGWSNNKDSITGHI
jgi:hypothetical protein